MKFRPSHTALALAAGLLVFGTFSLFALRGSRAQENTEDEITARVHVFPDIGAGIRALKRGSQGRYYFLSAGDHAVRVYSADGKSLGPIPRVNSARAAIIDGGDLDIDAAGRVYVADRGANAVKVYTPDGNLSFSMPVESPLSVVALASGQIAVASLKSRRLVTVYDAQGKYLREFGDFSDLAEHEDFNRFLNTGRLASDTASHVYYAFTYSPEPTIRKYDSVGTPAYEISLHTLDIYPSAQAQRRDISRIDLQGTLQPLPVVINAIGVDPQTEEVWVSLGEDLMKFSKDGTRLESYRTLDENGRDLSASAILIEPHRILLADDPHGIFEFARPDLPPTPQPKTK